MDVTHDVGVIWAHNPGNHKQKQLFPSYYLETSPKHPAVKTTGDTLDTEVVGTIVIRTSY